MEGPTDKETTTPPEELEQSVTSERSDLAADEVRRGQRTRKMTEKVRENKITALTNSFWKLHGKFAREIIQTETTMGKFCTKDTLGEMEVNLVQGLQEIEHIYEEMKMLSTAAPDQTIRMAIDRATADKDLLVAAIILRMTDQHTEQSTTHSHRSSSHRTTTSSRRSALEAEANAAAHMAELEALKEAGIKEEELLHLEMAETARRAEADAALKRQRRVIEQHRIEKLLRMEEAKVKVYCRNEPLESKQSNLFVKKTLTATSTDSESILVRQSKPEESPQQFNDFSALADGFAASMSLSRLPAPEPTIFIGDPLKYHDWSIAFKTLIEDKRITEREKIHYLKKYVGGPAKEAISGYFLLRSENAFVQAKALLEERYGNPFTVTEAFRDKLGAWPKISGRDGNSLRRFADFLNQCQAAMVEMKGLEILNDNRENHKLLRKLPDWVVNRWSRIASKSRKVDGMYPSFKRFAEFINEEASIACDPATSLGSLRGLPEQEHKDRQTSTTASQKKRNLATTTQSSDTQDKKCLSCVLCKRIGHSLAECRTFRAKPVIAKQEFVKTNGLCFGCLQYGHMSKTCMQKSTCKICQRRHPTSLHVEQKSSGGDSKRETPERSKSSKEAEKPDKAVVCRKVSNTGSEGMSTMIVPVWVSKKNSPKNEFLVYALLDAQSDTTFILEETAHILDPESETVSLRLSTMSARDNVIRCKKLQELQVRGYDSDVFIDLPTTYTRNFIRTDRSHIPTPTTANKWPHLRPVAHLIQPMQDCEVALLIGYNCPLALAPRSYVVGEGSVPFAIQTHLGWSVVGGTDLHEDGDAIGTTHRIVVKQIHDQLQPDTGQDVHRQEVRFVAKTTIKEVMDIPPAELVKILESDFKDGSSHDKHVSQDDMLFLEIIGSGIHHQRDGHYSMPFPFRIRPNLPNNRNVAVRRFSHLKRRFKSDKKYFEDYKSHMGGVWERQIRTIRNILTAILCQNNSRLDNSSLRTFLYETMAIVNSRPLAIENINDPLGPEALTPNHLSP